MCDEGRDVPEERKPELCLRGEVVAGREHTKRREVEAEENISRSTPCWLILLPHRITTLWKAGRGVLPVALWPEDVLIFGRANGFLSASRVFLRGRSSY